MRGEILLALAALFDCRDQCDIEVGFSASTSPVRIEVFDNAIYTSLYRSPDSERNTHPETARFSKDSQTYLIFRDECRRQLQLASSRKRFTTGESDLDLCQYVATLSFTGIGLTELETQRAEYSNFIAPFRGALATGATA